MASPPDPALPAAHGGAVRLGRPLANDARAYEVRKALPYLIDGLCVCALMVEGRHEFPPVSGMAIELLLDLLKIGTLVRGAVCDVVLLHSDHGTHPFPGVCVRHGIAALKVLGGSVGVHTRCGWSYHTHQAASKKCATHAIALRRRLPLDHWRRA